MKAKDMNLPLKVSKTKIPGIKPLKGIKIGDKMKIKPNAPAPMLGVSRKPKD